MLVRDFDPKQLVLVMAAVGRLPLLETFDLRCYAPRRGDQEESRLSFRPLKSAHRRIAALACCRRRGSKQGSKFRKEFQRTRIALALTLTRS